MQQEHPIFQAIVQGDYAGGWNAYLALAEPQALDQRWGGYCLFALGELLAAKDLLLQAKQGCPAAGLELATVLRHLGDLSGAHQELDVALQANVTPLEHAAMLRERGALYLYDGQAALACQELEGAWRELSALGKAGKGFQAVYTSLLGYAYAQLGRETHALHYLNLALVSVTGTKRIHPLHTRAQVFLQLGQYPAALLDLQAAAAELPGLPSAAARHAYLEGKLASDQGQWSDASGHFQRAWERAHRAGESGLKCIVELSLASILTAQGVYEEARTHLTRAELLVSNVWEKALFALRLGSWEAAQGQPAAARLEEARDAFVALELPSEAACAELQLAACALPQQPAEALAALKRAVDHRHRLGSAAPLLSELRRLPDLLQFMALNTGLGTVSVLLNDRVALGIDGPLHVRLTTLGGAQLLADGRNVSFRLKRMLELLTFIVLKGPISLQSILSHLWPDDDPRKAMNYFHQANYLLKTSTPYLRINFDKTSMLYSLQCTGPTFSADISDIKRLLDSGIEELCIDALQRYEGFLPDVETEWVREERDRMEWSMVQTALDLMARWSDEGRYDKCQSLSRRLVEVFPCDESLAEYLVESTLRLDGTVAAQRALLEMSGRAEYVLNQVPDWVGRLNQRIHNLN